KEVAEKVDKDFQGKRPLVVGILKGSIIFYADFIRFLSMPIELDFLAVSSYGSGAVSSGKLKIKKDLDRDVAGRDVIIVEDIIDSGFTLANLKALLKERGAASVTIVTLLDKAERREYDIKPDYNCFMIENEFVIGYGLDYDEQYRHLPYIGILKRSVYEK
ncbi:MAG: hypoxanthine phosphoribosyltransferase, partial [Clostridia bacterium]|nr:hypoxanthine phosphoribosyltransferase [Clostridia bacterium]